MTIGKQWREYFSISQILYLMGCLYPNHRKIQFVPSPVQIGLTVQMNENLLKVMPSTWSKFSFHSLLWNNKLYLVHSFNLNIERFQCYSWTYFIKYLLQATDFSVSKSPTYCWDDLAKIYLTINLSFHVEWNVSRSIPHCLKTKLQIFYWTFISTD